MSRYIVSRKKCEGKENYWITDTDTLILDLVSSRYLKHKSKEHLSPNTVKATAYAVSYYLNFLDEKKMTIEDVFALPYADQFDHFSDYLEWLKNGRHSNKTRLPNNNTCNSYLAVIFRFLLFVQLDQDSAGDLKVLTQKEASYVNDVGVRFKRMVMHFNGYLPPIEHKSREVDKENLEVLLDACSCLRNRLLLILLAETGMRIGEMLGVNYVRDIDFKKCSIRVRLREDNENKARAKNAEYRMTDISEKTLEILQSYIAENAKLLSKTEYLFVILHGKTAGKPMNANAVYSMLRRLTIRTGIEITPHMLRHYFANERRKADWDLWKIASALGHRSTHTTEIYLNVVEAELEAAAKKYYEENGSLYDIRKLL